MANEDDFTKLEMAAWGGLLGMHARLFKEIEADLAASAGISHAEFEVLLRLSWAEGRRLRLQELAERSILTRSGMSRVVERLEKAGLVTREAAREDGRGAYAVLTRQGLGEFRKALRSHVALVRRLFLKRFSARELEQMSEFWGRTWESPPGH